MPRKELTTVVPEPSESAAIQVEVTLAVRKHRRESRRAGQTGSVVDVGSRLRIPRITRLMALAIKFEAMVERREVRDYADLARLGYVSRARITQIMNLLNLAPDIQEQLLLCAPPTAKVCEKHLRRIVASPDWKEQREGWIALQLVRQNHHVHVRSLARE